MPEYDADEILARMRADTESDWPDRLLAAMAAAGRRELALPPLTYRQRQALALASLGRRSHAIARELGISQETAKTHLEQARVRLAARNRAEAVARAIRLGLID